jgi:hypothetical protein
LPTISLRLSGDELVELTSARRRVRRATYCQEATLWFAARVQDYIRAAGEDQASDILKQLLARLRPLADRWHRSLGAEFVLTFSSAEEVAPIDVARGEVARASFAYLAVRCRTRYDLTQAQTPPTLPQLAALVEPDQAGDAAPPAPPVG